MFWFNEEIGRLAKEKGKLNYQPEVVFYGSSSFRLWEDLYEKFEDKKPLNLGFGGSTLAACSWFFEDNFKNLNPKSILIYAGDNDLANGRHPEEVIQFFQTLLMKIRTKYGNIPVAFIAVKPSPSRWNIEGSLAYTNKIVKAFIAKEEYCEFIDIYDGMLDDHKQPRYDMYVEDHLHMNKKGYKIWYNAIRKYFEEIN